jgi:hypothetical protein
VGAAGSTGVLACSTCGAFGVDRKGVRATTEFTGVAFTGHLAISENTVLGCTGGGEGVCAETSRHLHQHCSSFGKDWRRVEGDGKENGKKRLTVKHIQDQHTCIQHRNQYTTPQSLYHQRRTCRQMICRREYVGFQNRFHNQRNSIL